MVHFLMKKFKKNLENKNFIEFFELMCNLIMPKNENQKNISPHTNHDFHYFFENRFFRTRYEKKVNSRYN